MPTPTMYLPPRSGSVQESSDQVEPGSALWIVLPTFNERENLPRLIPALLSAVPFASVLIVDDNSPDGTGEIADSLATAEPRVAVLHRESKQGLGAAYRAGFRAVLSRPGVDWVAQMDCDFSHDPRDLARLVSSAGPTADLVLGSRYVAGGATPGWSRLRRFISRGGSLFARSVLGLPYRDLTGGFKVWRREALAEVLESGSSTSGYGFQVETTYRAHQIGARIREVPITFRDRTAGTSKMSATIVGEAMVMVLRLRSASAL